jgi:hypothetical protein
MINRSVFSDLSINFVDLSIGVLTHRSVLSSKTIYRSVFLFIDFQNFHFLKKLILFAENRSSEDIKPDRFLSKTTNIDRFSSISESMVESLPITHRISCLL